MDESEQNKNLESEPKEPDRNQLVWAILGIIGVSLIWLMSYLLYR